MKRSRMSRSGKSRLKTLSVYDIDNPPEILKMISGKEHIGTYFIAGGGFGLKTKTFNLYRLDRGFIITNSYGTELVSARVYPDMKSVKRAYTDVKWEKYHLPLLPK